MNDQNSGDVKLRKMHEAALQVLDSYKRDGEPFALFLSSWRSDQVVQEFAELLHEIGLEKGPLRPVQERIGVERNVRVSLMMSGLETLAVYRRGDAERIAIPDEWPSLVLSDDEWRGRVEEAVRLADLIIVFWGADSDGITEELQICATGGNPLKTVVISKLPPLQIHLTQLDKTFPRIALIDDIIPTISYHEEFAPLIARMKAIKATDVQVRQNFIDPKARMKRFPLPPTTGRFQMAHVHVVTDSKPQKKRARKPSRRSK